ncbi:hypothetical protein BDD12DRAFT_855928 [Trichophaea hybrida]|nr:hypothetical protein BDD12DRAFT_855928 [Trichophaea hybrida]
MELDGMVMYISHTGIPINTLPRNQLDQLVCDKLITWGGIRHVSRYIRLCKMGFRRFRLGIGDFVELLAGGVYESYIESSAVGHRNKE